MGYRIGIDTLSKFAGDFGLGSKTGVQLTGEISGQRANRDLATQNGEVWTTGYTLSASIGQVYNNFTPVQMAKYISILVNKGKQIDPTIVKTIINADGGEVDKEEWQAKANERTGFEGNNNENIDISEDNLKAIMEGMKGVTSESGGTAYRSFWKLQYRSWWKNWFCTKDRS